MRDLLERTPAGLYCRAGDFHVDPLRRVARAVTTHAHSDHCRRGMGAYWCAQPGVGVLKRRIGLDATVHGVAYGERFVLGDVEVSFHPAGHILGSAQVRVSDGHTTWVVAGDFKRAADPTCAPFEVVPCDVFVSEATFGLPIYRWASGSETATQMLDWWRACRTQGKAAVITAYSLGKAQRILGHLHQLAPEMGPAYLHGAMLDLTAAYRAEGVPLLATEAVKDQTHPDVFRGALVIAPPSAVRSEWITPIGPFECAFASGWTRVRRRQSMATDRGFVMSDHADWPALVRTAQETGAPRVLVQYAPSDALARHLRGLGIDATTLARS